MQDRTHIKKWYFWLFLVLRFDKHHSFEDVWACNLFHPYIGLFNSPLLLLCWVSNDISPNSSGSRGPNGQIIKTTIES